MQQFLIEVIKNIITINVHIDIVDLLLMIHMYNEWAAKRQQKKVN